MDDIAKRYGFKSARYIFVFIILVIKMISLISPKIMEIIIDNYIPQKEIRMVFLGSLAYLFLPFVGISLQVLYNYFSIKYIRKKGNEISLDVMRKLIYQGKQFYDKENSAEILSYSSKEAVGYVNFYLADLSNYYVMIVLSIFSFLIIFSIHPILGLIQLFYIPFAKIPVKKMTEYIKSNVDEVVTKNAEKNQVLADIFRLIEFVKINNLEEKKIEEVKEINNTINKYWGRIAALDATSGMWMNGFASIVFTGLSLGTSSFLVLSENLKIGKMFSVLLYASLYYEYINTILGTTVNKAKQEAEYQKLFSYLELSDERTDNEGKKPFSLNRFIKMDNLSFEYNPDRVIFQDFNLSFEKGRWIGITGNSGSGKTTLFDLILKFYPVRDGMIYFDEVDINNIDTFDLRKNIQKISQEVSLFPGTIKDNLELVNTDASDDDFFRALNAANLAEYIAKLPEGINTDVGEAGKLMSGGEKQRLSIAMGLLTNKRILLLDEVTSNLDKDSQKIIKMNLKSLRDSGYTIISISHDMSFLDLADEVVNINEIGLSS